MRYRKFKADHLFDGKDILTGDKVLVTDEKGIVETVIEAIDAGGDIEIFKGLLSPGFVNCHCHLELSHMKDVIENGTGLVDFLLKVVSKRSSVKEEIEAAMKPPIHGGLPKAAATSFFSTRWRLEGSSACKRSIISRSAIWI